MLTKYYGGWGSANDYVIFFSARHGKKNEKLLRSSGNFFGVSFNSTFFRFLKKFLVKNIQFHSF